MPCSGVIGEAILVSADLATASFRTESGVTEDEPWTLVDSAALSDAVPWRTFRWYKGQKHYSGTYWSATMRDHVVYESRLELSRLIFADFDKAMHRILAQPFLLKAKVDEKVLGAPESPRVLLLASILARHRGRGEPVTWHPPFSLLSDLDLPGPDPSLIDVTRLHELVRERANPVQHAAEICRHRSTGSRSTSRSLG